MKKKNELLALFLSFFKIGAFTFGGGLAMIPLMADEAVKRHHWVSDEDILDMVVISEATPGVLAVNLATYIGYRVGKFWGSLISTIAVVLPSIITIIIISFFLQQFKDNQIIQNLLLGIKGGVVVLIFHGVSKLYKALDKRPFSIAMMITAFIFGLLFDIPVIFILITAAIFGMLYRKYEKENYHD